MNMTTNPTYDFTGQVALVTGAVRWYRKFGQWLKLGLLLRRTDLDDEQEEAVFGGFQGEGRA